MAFIIFPLAFCFLCTILRSRLFYWLSPPSEWVVLRFHCLHCISTSFFHLFRTNLLSCLIFDSIDECIGNRYNTLQCNTVSQFNVNVNVAREYVCFEFLLTVLKQHYSSSRFLYISSTYFYASFNCSMFIHYVDRAFDKMKLDISIGACDTHVV